MTDTSDHDADPSDVDTTDVGMDTGTNAETEETTRLSPARFVLSMALSVVLTVALVGAMAWGVWTLLPSPFGLAGAAILLGGALLGNALVVRRNYQRWQRSESEGGSV